MTGPDAPGRPSALAELHREAGAVLRERDGAEVPRHYGDPTAEYRAATEGAAVFDRSHRALLPVEGRAPGKMLTGIVTGRMPPDLEEAGAGAWKGEAPFSLVLTPKGRPVAELRLLRLGGGEAGGLLMDVPPAALEGLLKHLGRYLPPRFAKIVEPAEPLGMLTVVGPDAAAALARAAPELRAVAAELEALAEGEERIARAREASADAAGPADGIAPAGAVRAVRNGDVHPFAFDLVAPASLLRTFWGRLRAEGVIPAGLGAWDTLRIEKGRPAYGAELDGDVLPPEAGLDPRAIDHRKGCYTGQEVIVRIRDRGRVNRHLRGFLLGEAPTPAAGTPLFIEGRDRPAGEIRSVAQSPRFGQGIALGYLRREAGPPTTARLGAADGPEIGVRAIGDDGWELAAGDPEG